MTRAAAVLASALLLFAVPAGVRAQTPAGLPASDIAKINDMTASLEKAIAAKNGAAAGAIYAEDASLYPPGLPMVKGRAQIQASLALLGVVSNIALKNTSVEGRGDIAYVQGSFTVTLPPTSTNPKPTPANGYFLDVRRKQPDGRWFIVTQMLAPGK